MEELEHELIVHIKCISHFKRRLKTAGRFFPSRNFQGANSSFIAQRKESLLNYYPAVKTGKFRLRENSQRKNVARTTCYNFKPKIGAKIKRNDKRPMTGSISKYKLANEISIIPNENDTCKLKSRARTAQRCEDNGAEIKYISHRVSTPQTALQKRPGSRYNKANLYKGLENGKKSPEYKVPIIDMNLKDYAYHNSVLPSFWKE